MSWWGQKSESGIVMTELYYLYSFCDTSCCYNHIKPWYHSVCNNHGRLCRLLLRPCHALPCLGLSFPSHCLCCTNTFKEKCRGNLCSCHCGWLLSHKPCISAAASLAEQTRRSCSQSAYPENSLLHLCRCLLPFTSFNSKGRSTFYPITTNWLKIFFPRSTRENSFKSKNLKLTITWSEAPVKKSAILINEYPKILGFIAYSNFDTHSFIPTGNL